MLRTFAAAKGVDIHLVVARILDRAVIRCCCEPVEIVGSLTKRRGQGRLTTLGSLSAPTGIGGIGAPAAAACASTCGHKSEESAVGRGLLAFVKVTPLAGGAEGSGAGAS
jgi:hypothetical protein